MKKITFLCFALISLHAIHAQNFTWKKTGDTLMTDRIEFLGADKHKNIYSVQAGFSYGQSGYWAKEGYLRKMKYNGTLLWEKEIKMGYYGWPLSLATDRNGNSYLGMMGDAALLGDTLNSGSFSLYKLDNTGNMLWKAGMRSDPLNTVAATDGQGNTLVSADFCAGNTGNYTDTFTVIGTDTVSLNSACMVMAKINSSGQKEWHKIIETDGFPSHHACIGGDQVLLAGRFNSWVKIDGILFPNCNGDNIFIALFDQAGILRKFKGIRGNYFSYSGGYFGNNNVRVYADSLGNLFLSDQLNDYFLYDSIIIAGTAGSYALGLQHSVFARLDTGLNLLWSAKVPASVIYKANTDNSSGILLSIPGHLVYKLKRANGDLLFCQRDNSDNYCAAELSNGKFVLGGSFTARSVFGDPAAWSGYYANTADYYLALASLNDNEEHIVAGFTLPSSVCKGETMPLNNTSINAYTCLWTWGSLLGDSSLQPSPIIAFQDTGFNQVTLLVNNGPSSDVVTKSVYVKPLPDMVVSAPASVCAPDSIISFAKSGCADSIHWNAESTAGYGWFESNMFNWKDTLHWGREFIGADISYNAKIYKDGCSLTEYMTVKNTVPGFGSVIYIDGTHLASTLADAQVPLQWYYNGDPLPGETGPVLALQSSGNYQCRFGDSCCYFSGIVNFDSATAGGISAEPAEYGIKVYPNPARGCFEISCKHAVASVELYDLSGRCLMSARPGISNPRLNCAVAGGIYTLKIRAGEKEYLTKLVVEE